MVAWASPILTDLSERSYRSKCARELGDDAHMTSMNRLRAVMPAAQLEAKLAVSGAARNYDPKTRPIASLFSKDTKRKGLPSVKFEKPGLKLKMTGGRP